jgi:hypothetical protein
MPVLTFAPIVDGMKPGVVETSLNEWCNILYGSRV